MSCTGEESVDTKKPECRSIPGTYVFHWLALALEEALLGLGGLGRGLLDPP